MTANRIRTIFLCVLLYVIGVTNQGFTQDPPQVVAENYIGGWSVDCVLHGDYVYFAHGRFLSILDITGSPMTLVNSLKLNSECNKLKVHNNHLYVFYTFKDTAIDVYTLSQPTAPAIVHRMPIRSRFPFAGAFLGNRLAMAMDDSAAVFDASTSTTLPILQTIYTQANQVAVNDSLLAIAGPDSLHLYTYISGQYTSRSSIALQGITVLTFYNNRLLVGKQGYPDIGVGIYDFNLTRLSFAETFIKNGNVTAYKNPSQIIVREQLAYVATTGGANLFIIDISNDTDPQIHSSQAFEEGVYPSARGLALGYPNAYMATGSSDNGLLRWDITNPAAPVVESSYQAPWDGVDLCAKGDTVFIASAERIWTYKVHEDAQYTVLGSDTAYHGIGHLGIGNGHLLALNESTLNVVDYSNPNHLQTLGQYVSSNGKLMNVESDGQSAILFCNGESVSTIEWIDISTPAQPAPLASHELTGSARDLFLLPSDSLAFAAVHSETADQIHTLDYTDLNNIIDLGVIPLESMAMCVWVGDTLLLAGSADIAANTWNLESFSINDISNPIRIARTGGQGIIIDVKVYEGIAYASIQGNIDEQGSKALPWRSTTAQDGHFLQRSGQAGGGGTAGIIAFFEAFMLQKIHEIGVNGAMKLILLPLLAVLGIIIFLGFISPSTLMPSGSMGLIIMCLAGAITGINPAGSLSGNQPNTPVLEQNYPNPFNPTTTIRYHIDKMSKVKLTVYNVNGRKIGCLVDGTKNNGVHEIRFDGREMASGMYTYVLEINGKRQSQRMLLVK
ncbi:T9SS type A sorting domain-containing protein [bacterium]|nr:T9SS type A sorting domain-containing protein [bacterium]